jgi:uncharacterized membrane protein YbhN (UPF0104 family)
MPDKKLKKVIVNIVKWLLVGLILYFIIRQIATQWHQVKTYQWKINWVYLVSSIIVLQIGFFFKSSLWMLLLTRFKTHIGVWRAFRVYYLSNLGRYVPGKVVQFAGIMYLAKREGVREDVAVSSFALDKLFDTPAGILVVSLYYFLLGASFDQIRHYLSLSIILGAVTVALLLVIFIPSLLERALNLLLRIFKRPRIEFKMEKKIGFGLLFLYFIAWNIFGASFYLFIQAITEAPSSYFLQSCLIYTAAYLVGYWALFAPGGIGVREGVIGTLLYELGGFAESIAYTVGLASRLWFTIGEVVVTILALLVRSKKANVEKEKTKEH